MKIKSILIFIAAITTISSCNKENFNYPPGKVGISTIVYYAAIATNGAKLIILYQGASYTDAGATATLGGVTTTYKTAGTVNTAVAGIYPITYSASNAQGNIVTDFRTVVVIGSDVASNDFSGTYLRTSPAGVTCVWTKDPNYKYGVYDVQNPGGSSSATSATVIAVNYTGTNIKIPMQISPTITGPIYTSDETYTIGPPSIYTWTIHNGGYGGYARTFTKQ